MTDLPALQAPLLAAFFSYWLWPLAQFLIGLSIVVFVHELGHFLVAKWVGIKVEKFALGFGPRLVGIVRGETDYCINVIPLGGYVKMLGQEDFAPNEDSSDPRAYHNKSVGARFAVISAGVIMNVILAGLLFVGICLVGKQFPASVVGGVRPGYPAAAAKITWQDADGDAPAKAVGLEAGDRITAINGERIERFKSIAVEAALAYRDEVFRFEIARPVEGGVRRGTAEVGVREMPDGMMLGFGIEPPLSNEVFIGEEAREQTPLRSGDRIVEIAGRPIDSHWQIREVLAELPAGVESLRIPVRVERDENGSIEYETLEMPADLRSAETVFYRPSGEAIRGEMISAADSEGGELTILVDGSEERFAEDDLVIPARESFLDILGLVPALKIDRVISDSPAERGGLAAGDVILRFADTGNLDFRSLRDLTDEHKDRPTPIVVLRDGERVSLSVTPENNDGRATIGVLLAPAMDRTVVSAVRAGSPAARAGVLPLAEMLAIRTRPGEEAREDTPWQEISSWMDLFTALRARQGEAVQLKTRVGELEQVRELGEVTDEQFRPADYRMTMFSHAAFEPVMVTIRKTNPFSALVWGVKETGDWVVNSYASLRALVLGTASTKGVMGPVGLGTMAVEAGRKGLGELVYLMAFFSAAIAVFNFLPLPVLDGGHAVLLLIEKIRGKPLPLKVVNAIQMAGLVLLLAVFLAVTFQDILRWF